MSIVRPSSTVHCMCSSVNCAKVRLLLEQLDSRHHWVKGDSGTKQARSTSALAMRLHRCVRALRLMRVGDPRLPVAASQEH